MRVFLNLLPPSITKLNHQTKTPLLGLLMGNSSLAEHNGEIKAKKALGKKKPSCLCVPIPDTGTSSFSWIFKS